MSVLIKGMEIPDKCGHCRFATAFECEVTKNFITTFNVRQQDCPLVPVPPHGRLIDADALVKEVEDIAKELPSDSVGAERFKLFAEFITEMPTIIPAEPPKEET